MTTRITKITKSIGELTNAERHDIALYGTLEDAYALYEYSVPKSPGVPISFAMWLIS